MAVEKFAAWGKISFYIYYFRPKPYWTAKNAFGMENKDFYTSLDESFTLNEIEELEKFPFQQLYSRKT